MSTFFRMPKSWHDSLDASLPPIYPIDFMTGTKAQKIIRRLSHVLETVSVIKKWDFCKREGIDLIDLNSAMNNKSFALKIWEDGNKIGAIK
jgi:uncharacterized protein YkuJ